MAARQNIKAPDARLHISLHGAVQGVGFRPFVYRLATEMGLRGWVLNSSQGVFIEVEGEYATLDSFVSRLEKEKPPRAFIQGLEISFLEPVGFTEFEIKESDSGGEKRAIVLPDIATCSECSADLFDPANRRFLYPFTNCTNCGPRFSIIRSLPYDRLNTTMANFEMCDECRAEYDDPSNRRFHAQPNACPKCGPHLELWDSSGRVLEIRSEAMLKAAEAIRAGKIVALKGIGGFQLLADARNEDAVKCLRARKHREEKPLALMYPSLDRVKHSCEVSDLEERLLLSPEAPIVLLRRRETLSRLHDSAKSDKVEQTRTLTTLAASVAPRNPYLGVMLPYTPLHLILMHELGFPIVATSGNISDEPICIDEHDALNKLGAVADLFLVHDRPIERQVDDSVVRVMAGRTQVVRRARGFAPFPIEMHSSICNPQSEVVLAVGGHLKNTIAINSWTNVVISQHIGDLSTHEAFQAFEKVTGDFQRLYEVSPGLVVHDLHPDYLSSQFARRLAESPDSMSSLGVQHHFAHVASCMAENMLSGRVLGVSWDGTGYGEDGTIWGGEFLVTDGKSYDRSATFRAFRLPGGSSSIKEPRRTALGALYEIFGDAVFKMTGISPVLAFDSHSLILLRKMLESGLNSPLTTSAGRLFDAVASIVGIRQVVNFEGQGAMELEFALEGVNTDETYGFEINGDRRREEGNRRYFEPARIVNWEPIVGGILADLSDNVSVGVVSAKFHNTLCEIIVDVAKRVGEKKVVLSGGCFQNKYLTEHTVKRLEEEGFKAYRHQRVPPNDGGIALGQMYVAFLRLRRKIRYGEKDAALSGSEAAV
ncbi:MAG: carbamoyltransferase HypF [Bacteroidetes bacterium]|nr:carbamoyltransferase HypF [Bacteroidota bacterium]